MVHGSPRALCTTSPVIELLLVDACVLVNPICAVRLSAVRFCLFVVGFLVRRNILRNCIQARVFACPIRSKGQCCTSEIAWSCVVIERSRIAVCVDTAALGSKSNVRAHGAARAHTAELNPQQRVSETNEAFLIE